LTSRQGEAPRLQRQFVGRRNLKTHGLSYLYPHDRPPDHRNGSLDAAQIVDVIQEFVPLKKRGANYLGLCPFITRRLLIHRITVKGDLQMLRLRKVGQPPSTSSWSTSTSHTRGAEVPCKKISYRGRRERALPRRSSRKQNEREESSRGHGAYAARQFSENLFQER